MGWDAIATNKEYSKEITEAFESASEKVRQTVGSVDGYLRVGGLDCHESGRCLEFATGKSVYVEEWTSEEVKTLAKSANWEQPNSYEQWAQGSALFFLDTCAKYGLGIKFSW